MAIRATAASLTRSITVTFPSAVETYAHNRNPGRRNDGRCSRRSSTTPAITRTPTKKYIRKLRGRFIGRLNCYTLSAELPRNPRIIRKQKQRKKKNAHKENPSQALN